jgi:PAS domain S-box-containing protein
MTKVTRFTEYLHDASLRPQNFLTRVSRAVLKTLAATALALCLLPLAWPSRTQANELKRALIVSQRMERIHFPHSFSQSQKKTWIQKNYANIKLSLVNEVAVVPSNIFPGRPVPASALPASILFLNIQPTVRGSYQWYITGAAILFLTETLLILGLLRQWTKNRKFQQSFVESMAFEKMLADLSTTFVSLPEDEIGANVEKSFSRIGQFLNIDRITLFEYSRTNAELKMTFSWCAGAVLPVPAVLKAEMLPWAGSLQRGEPVFVSDLETLPEEASSEREHVRKFGAISVVTFPLKSGDKLFGSISFASAKRTVFWTEVLVQRLKLLAEIFSNALMRKSAQQVLRESEERFHLAANAAPVMLWMSGTDKHYTFFNQGWRSFTGRSMEQELGDGWVSGVHPEDVENCMAIYSASFDARVDFQMEYRLLRFDGDYRWIVDFGVPRFESDGTFCGYIGSCVDITERKLSEESLRMLTGRLIRAQEEERARIARDLHDDFSQRLALLAIGLGQLWKKLPKSEEEERSKILEMLSKTKEMCSDIHSLSHQLHSSKLEHVGLGPALRGLCEEVNEKYKIEVQFIECEVPSRIPKDIALCLFRVSQEALSNVVKHSNTKDAQVELRSNANYISLRISDAGRGFDSGLQDSKVGIGLVGMSERLRLVGGRLLVKSEPQRGTDILAEVPLIASVEEAHVKIQAAGRES